MIFFYFFPENAAEAIANATIKMESETVQKIFTIEKPEVKTFDILEQAVSTIKPGPIEDSSIDNRVPQNLYTSRIPEKANTIPKNFTQPKYPVNTGNILCPECDLRFDSINGAFVFVRWDKKSKENYIANKMIDPGVYYNLKAARELMRKQTNKATFDVEDAALQAGDQEAISTTELQDLREQFKLDEEERKLQLELDL